MWAPWFVLGLALALTILVTLYVAASTRENDQMRFERRIAEATRDLEDRMATYVSLLHGVSGLFSASHTVTHDEFSRYVDRLKLDELYGGIQGIGVSARVPQGRAGDLRSWMFEQRGAPFQIWPQGPREQLHAVIFLQPEDQRNRRVIGYDMFTDPVRREAMERARDQGVAAASGRVALVQSPEFDELAGFLIYVPIYRGGQTPATVEARREQLIGFAFSPFRAVDLFQHTFGVRTRTDVSIHVYDTASIDAKHLLFATTAASTGGADGAGAADTEPVPREAFNSRFTKEVSIQVAGRPWTLVFASQPAFEAQSFAGVLVPFTLLAGLMTSLMLFGVTLAQSRAHDQAERAAANLRRSEGALRRTEERLQMAMAAADLFAVAWDLRSDRLTCVGEAKRILGTLPTTGDEFAALIHPDDRLLFEQSTARAMAGEGPHEAEFRIVKDDGSVHWLRDRAVIELDSDGNPQRMVGICADVTRQKAVEHELRALNETLEQRVADRTLEAERRSAQLRALASELTQAEQRERRRLAQVLHDHLQQLLVAAMMRMGPARNKAPQEMDESLQQVEDLIRQSIAASRSLTIELSPPVLYDAGLCKGLEWLARSMRDKHGLTIELSCDADAEPSGEDLRAFLFQAVRELLFNIVKHSQAKEAKVILTRAEGDRIRIVVEDPGQGFDPSILRAQGAMAEHFGLFSIQQRLELLGGRLDVQSPVPALGGRGVRVTLLAPMSYGKDDSTHVSQILSDLPESEEYSAAEKLLETYVTPSAAPHAVRVLLAEDPGSTHAVLSAALHAQEDIELVGEASDGQDVVNMARRLRPDVVLLDMAMKQLDGVQTARQVVADMPRTRVIALSVDEADPAAAAMRDAGVHAFADAADTDTLLTLIRGQTGGATA